MKRLISALILLPVLILTILKGGPLLFACLLAIFVFIGIHEFYRMALPDRTVEVWPAAVCGTLLIFVPFFGNDRHLLAGVAFLFLAFALLFLFRIREVADAAREIAHAMLAFLYIPFLLMHLVMLRQTPYGIQWLLVIMLIVMTNDSAAYYTGGAFGKHRLYPLVSPKKSIEGALGGLAGSIGGTLIAKFSFFPQLSFRDALATALFIGALGQAGDLFESLLKRSFGVKDSGTIIPGHGGVLDRLDSIIFAAPALYYYVIYFFKG
ncbi:phosphatidate cytidylyltransferase [Geobacter sp. FeAm09]|uniref:phosphatidate cytidylyltransferase n=1 Tax=Geobacter sp. FeAm09 TaxID=2597769 RepID=UPI0011EE26D9|nr:phosphatidate cytidylyltransferase [Geobacter sp. FeAm09]QEM69084.1 phosphatidate cytidylyltransferase [Geobacter sp. FeAm09]